MAAAGQAPAPGGKLNRLRARSPSPTRLIPGKLRKSRAAAEPGAGAEPEAEEGGGRRGRRRRKKGGADGEPGEEDGSGMAAAAGAAEEDGAAGAAAEQGPNKRRGRRGRKSASEPEPEPEPARRRKRRRKRRPQLTMEEAVAAEQAMVDWQTVATETAARQKRAACSESCERLTVDDIAVGLAELG